MAIIDLPTSGSTAAARLVLSVQVSYSGYTGFFTGTRQRRSNLADRMRAQLIFPPCTRDQAGLREALILGLLSTGDQLRLPMPHRPTRGGTMAGSPTVTTTTAAGAMTLPITTSAGATLLPGDFISVGGNLLQAAYTGATASGAGAMSLPLVLPTQKSITAGAAVVYSAPTGVWEIEQDGIEIDYSPGNIQGGIAVPLLQVIL